MSAFLHFCFSAFLHFCISSFLRSCIPALPCFYVSALQHFCVRVSDLLYSAHVYALRHNSSSIFMRLRVSVVGIGSPRVLRQSPKRVCGRAWQSTVLRRPPKRFGGRDWQPQGVTPTVETFRRSELAATGCYADRRNVSTVRTGSPRVLRRP